MENETANDNSPEILPSVPKNNKPKFKKVASWVSVIRDAFSILATLVSFATLVMLIKQNERTYRPDLVLSIEKSVIDLKFNDSLVHCNDIEITAVGDSIGQFPKFYPVNIGLGAARNVQFNWEVDLHGLCDTVTFEGQTIPTFIQFAEDLDALVYKSCMYQRSADLKVDYILPVSSGGESITVEFPSNYLIAWNNLLVKMATLERLSPEESVDLVRKFINHFQRASLVIRFADINNQQYQKVYELVLVPQFIDLTTRKGLIRMLLREQNGRQAPKEKFNLIYKSDVHGARFLPVEI